MNRIFLAVAPVLAILPAAAQSRLPDGKPDLAGTGVWSPRAVRDIAGKTDVPFQPWAKTKFQENSANRAEDTERHCLPPGIPRIAFSARPFEILQFPNRIVFVYEGGPHIFRQVWMDGRPHPQDPNPSWMGDSIGHWEGDSLVVDSVGFNDRTWLDEAGHPHTDKLHVIEKYTRAGAASMKYEVTIDDPGAYTRSWTASATIPFRAGGQMAEYLCLDDGRDTRRASDHK